MIKIKLAKKIISVPMGNCADQIKTDDVCDSEKYKKYDCLLYKDIESSMIFAGFSRTSCHTRHNYDVRG